MMRIATILIVASLSSCTTYIIPKSTLVEQLSTIDSIHLIKKRIVGPFGSPPDYLANPITIINCETLSGEHQTLANSPSIEIRVTEVDGKKTIFYFDRVMIVNDQLVGVRSRFAPAIDKEIELENITLIEVQDGKKKFKYAQ